MDHIKGSVDYILQYSDVEVLCVTNGYAEELSRSKRVVAPSGAREQSHALPLEAPKFLIVRSGRDIVNYNLHAFKPVTAPICGDVARGPASVARRVSNCRLVGASLMDLLYNNESSTEPFTCLYFIDETGNVGLLSLDRNLAPACYAGLLDSIFKQQRPCALSAASLCSNGNLYLVKDDLIFTVCVNIPPLSYAASAPSTVSLNLGSPPWGVEPLRHGREELLARATEQLEKQRNRTNMFSMSSVTDLDKVFASSRPRGLASLGEDGEEDHDGGSNKPPTSTAYAQGKSTEAMRDIAEARKNMEENREKLQKINVRSEEMANAAGEFQAGAAASRRRLEERHKKWSIF